MQTSEAYIEPTRPKPRFRPFKAMQHMNRLLADKEDTAQVFYIIEALSGDALRRNLEEMLSTQAGRDRLAERRALAPLLDDHANLEPLPEDSVGRAYINFMKREGLTAAGLVKESEIRQEGQPHYDDDLEWYANRLRDTHDLYHVLSGYGRDGLGEAALLLFSHGLQPSRGIKFISNVGFSRMRKTLPKPLRLREVQKEARENGRRALSIVNEDIMALLYEPLSSARERLQINPPTAYREALLAYNALPTDMQAMAAV